jgi:hypothetical protein
VSNIDQSNFERLNLAHFSNPPVLAYAVVRSCHWKSTSVRTEAIGVQREPVLVGNFWLRHIDSVVRPRFAGRARALPSVRHAGSAHPLAQFASYCEARDRPDVTSTALARPLVLAFKSAAVSYRKPHPCRRLTESSTIGARWSPGCASTLGCSPCLQSRKFGLRQRRDTPTSIDRVGAQYAPRVRLSNSDPHPYLCSRDEADLIRNLPGGVPIPNG